LLATDAVGQQPIRLYLNIYIEGQQLQSNPLRTPVHCRSGLNFRVSINYLQAYMFTMNRDGGSINNMHPPKQGS
jgi:hypothetical protein